MASSGKEEAKFSVSIDGNAAKSSREMKTSVEEAAKEIEKYEAEVKKLSGDLKRLRGNSDEVSSAKKELKDQVTKTREVISDLTLKIRAQGSSYEEAAKSAKKYEEAAKSVKEHTSGIKRAAELLRGAKSDFGEFFSPIGNTIGGRFDAAQNKIKSALAPVKDKLVPVKNKIGSALAPTAKKIGDTFGKTSQAIGAKLEPAKKVIGAISGAVGKAAAKVGTAVKPLASGVVKIGQAGVAALKPLASSALPAVGEGLGLVAGAAGAAVVAIGALVIGAAAGTAALVAFGLSSSDAAAKMQRQRQALLGNAEDAKAFGTQITEMAKKVPQGTEELNALAVSLAKTRLTGTSMVNTFKAVSQVTGAIDSQAGAKIQDLITRMQRTGRMAIGRYELDGTGIDFDEVAKEYAAGTKKSVAAAAQELRSGRASIEAGSEALAKAAEKKFGKLNIENAFSLENAPKKFMETFRSLSSGINLTPVSKALQDAFGQLSPNAPLGAAVKQFMTTLGQGFVDVAAKAIPVLVEGFKWLVVGGMKVEIFFLELKKSITDAFTADGFIGAGRAIVEGIVKGIKGYYTFAYDAITSFAGTIKDAFTGPKGIDAHSPSKAFERYGENSVDGFVGGVQRGTQKAEGATQSMAQAAIGGASSQSTTTDNSTRYGNVTINISVSSKDDAESLQSPSFISSLAMAVRAGMSNGVAA